MYRPYDVLGIMGRGPGEVCETLLSYGLREPAGQRVSVYLEYPR